MPKTEFDRIAGYKEEKAELSKLCNLIKKREELSKIGGKLPRGLFLIGPNGVGKTIMAKSFIKESGCESIDINYNDLDDSSDFVTYIKSKFAEAAKKAPCILFIDELDKLIGNSSQFFIEDNFDRSRVILNEINKYSDVEGLFLLVVANGGYRLDQSIIRSGRIDRIIEINLPTENERHEILNYYATQKTLDNSVDLKRLSAILNGFSGADIESLMNNAVIKAFTEDRKTIINEDIMSVFYDKVFKCKEKASSFDEKSAKMLAYHEAGHAALTLLFNPSSINCSTILARNGVKGFVSRHFSEDKLTTFEDEKNSVKIALAGLVVEELVFGERTTGSSNDIFKAHSTISDLVRNQGISGLNNILVERNDFPSTESCSESKLSSIEKAEDELMSNLLKETKEIVSNNINLVKAIATELINKKILNKDDLDTIFDKYKKEKGS